MQNDNHKEPEDCTLARLQYRLTDEGLTITLPLTAEQRQSLTELVQAYDDGTLYDFFDTWVQCDESWHDAWHAVEDACLKRSQAELASILMETFIEKYHWWPSVEAGQCPDCQALEGLAGTWQPSQSSIGLDARPHLRLAARAAWQLDNKAVAAHVADAAKADGWKLATGEDDPN